MVCIFNIFITLHIFFIKSFNKVRLMLYSINLILYNYIYNIHMMLYIYMAGVSFKHDAFSHHMASH